MRGVPRPGPEAPGLKRRVRIASGLLGRSLVGPRCRKLGETDRYRRDLYVADRSPPAMRSSCSPGRRIRPLPFSNTLDSRYFLSHCIQTRTASPATANIVLFGDTPSATASVALSAERSC
jgi:hypothetical protein